MLSQSINAALKWIYLDPYHWRISVVLIEFTSIRPLHIKRHSWLMGWYHPSYEACTDSNKKKSMNMLSPEQVLLSARGQLFTWIHECTFFKKRKKERKKKKSLGARRLDLRGPAKVRRCHAKNHTRVACRKNVRENQEKRIHQFSR